MFGALELPYARSTVSGPTDFELLDAWASGDKQAAKALLDRYFDGVFRFMRNKLGSEGAEDLVQDTFLACVQSRDRFRRESSFRTFVFATARNVLLNHYRKRRRDGDPLDPELASVVDLAPGPSTIAVQKQEQRVLLEALRALPLDSQIVLELYHWERLTGPELAGVLCITEAALRSRLHRAKNDLRARIEAIEASGALLESTLANLDDWAAGLRDAALRR